MNRLSIRRRNKPTNISGKREHLVGGSGGSNKNSRGDDNADRSATSVRRDSVPVNPSTISRHCHQNQSQARDIITPPRNSSRRNKRSRGEDNDGPTYQNQSPTITTPNSSTRTVAKANLRHIAKTSDMDSSNNNQIGPRQCRLSLHRSVLRLVASPQ